MVKKIKNVKVTKLAKEILKESTPLLNEEKFVPFERSKPVMRVAISVAPILLPCAKTLESALIVNKTEQEIYNFLDKHFGYQDGSYFIHCETIQTRRTPQGTKKLKGLLLEDMNNFRYTLWFDITNIGYIKYV